MSMRILRQVAIFGGVISLGGAGYFTHKIQSNFRKQEYHKESLKLLRGYPAARELLGQPILAKRLDLGDVSKNWADGYNARLMIPVKGPRNKGHLHTWATRPDHNSPSWRVDKLDLQIDDTQWTFYIHPDVKDVYKPTGSEKKTDKQTNQQTEQKDKDSKPDKSSELFYLNLQSLEKKDTK